MSSPQIVVEHLTKSFRVAERQPGALGAMTGLFTRAARHAHRAARAGDARVGVAMHLSTIDWTWQSWAILSFAVAGGVALFSGILVLQATLAFWTVESLEVVNALTYGGVKAGQYPLDIYTRWFRDFLTFVVPLGCVSYFPVAAVLGHANRTDAPDWLLPLTPMVGFLFLAGSLWVWRFGVRRYTSTGS
jgi:ABC-2 type transport system permease protein